MTQILPAVFPDMRLLQQTKKIKKKICLMKWLIDVFVFNPAGLLLPSIKLNNVYPTNILRIYIHIFFICWLYEHTFQVI